MCVLGGGGGVVMGNNILFTDRWADSQRGLYAGGLLSGSLRYWMCYIIALLNSAALLILTYFSFMNS